MIRDRKLILLLVGALFFGCSFRQTYQQPVDIVVHAPDAVNINTASVDELEKLPHIGRKTAEKIAQFREENGPFRRPKYRMQIQGISKNRFLQIRQYIRTK